MLILFLKGVRFVLRYSQYVLETNVSLLETNKFGRIPEEYSVETASTYVVYLYLSSVLTFLKTRFDNNVSFIHILLVTKLFIEIMKIISINYYS